MGDTDSTWLRHMLEISGQDAAARRIVRLAEAKRGGRPFTYELYQHLVGYLRNIVLPNIDPSTVSPLVLDAAINDVAARGASIEELDAATKAENIDVDEEAEQAVEEIMSLGYVETSPDFTYTDYFEYQNAKKFIQKRYMETGTFDVELWKSIGSYFGNNPEGFAKRVAHYKTVMDRREPERVEREKRQREEERISEIESERQKKRDKKDENARKLEKARQEHENRQNEERRRRRAQQEREEREQQIADARELERRRVVWRGFTRQAHVAHGIEDEE